MSMSWGARKSSCVCSKPLESLRCNPYSGQAAHWIAKGCSVCSSLCCFLACVSISALRFLASASVNVLGLGALALDIVSFVQGNNIEMTFVLDSDACTMTTDAHPLPVLYGPAQTTWFRATEVAAYLGYAQPRVAVTKLLKGHLSKRFCQIAPFSSIHKRYDPRARYINANGLKILCCKSRKPHSISLANGLGINMDDMKTVLQETKTLAALSEIFKGEDIKFQFPVGPYRVDITPPCVGRIVNMFLSKQRNFSNMSAGIARYLGSSDSQLPDNVRAPRVCRSAHEVQSSLQGRL